MYVRICFLKVPQFRVAKKKFIADYRFIWGWSRSACSEVKNNERINLGSLTFNNLRYQIFKNLQKRNIS
jgi:hypothetical protein